MEAITQYRAADRSIFSTEAACLAHEAEVAAVAAIMCPLGPRPSLSDYPVTQYLQHDPSVVLSVRVALVAHLRDGPLASWWRDPKWAAAPLGDFHPNGMLGRICSESGGPGCAAFGRFANIDNLGREWSQPYYTNHPPIDRVEVPQKPESPK